MATKALNAVCDCTRYFLRKKYKESQQPQHAPKSRFLTGGGYAFPSLSYPGIVFFGPGISIFPFFCLTLIEHPTRSKMETLRKVIRFYVEGFREMTVGRTLWAIILIKLFIMFAVLKVFFFPDLLAGKSPSEKAGCVLENLTDPKNRL